MALPYMNMPFLTPQQASPLMTGFQAGEDIIASMMQSRLRQQQAAVQQQEAEKMRQLMPFYAPTAQAELTGKQQQNEWNPRIWGSEIGLRGQQAREAGSQADKIRFMLSHPGLMAGGTAAEIEGLKLLGANVNLNSPAVNVNQPQQTDSQIQSSDVSSVAPFQTGNPLVDAMLNRKYASAAYQQSMVQGYNWAHLPVDAKNQLIAQGYGMGIEPLKMMQYVNQGMTLQQIAEKEGLDSNNLPPPRYAPTKGTLTRTQQVEQVGAELDYLSSVATQAIKPYANTFAGLSPDRIRDMLSNDPEAQKRFGRYMGALSIQTGIANGRVLLEGGRAGLEVMRMVKDSALKGIDQNSPIKMSSVAYQAAQDFIDENLQAGARIRTRTGMNPFSEISKSRSDTEKKEGNAKSETIRIVRDKSGKLVRAG